MPKFTNHSPYTLEPAPWILRAAKINLSQVQENHRTIYKTVDPVWSNGSLQNTSRAIPVINWHSCYHAITNDKQQPENVTQALLLKALIRGMAGNPMVRLFSEQNLTGNFEDRIFGQNKHPNKDYRECYPIYTLRKVKSAQTFGTCVRLFANWNCLGMSWAVYERPENSFQTVDTNLHRIKSVGPCLDDEFMSATFVNKTYRYVVKNINSDSYFPDSAQFGSFAWKKTLIWSRDGVNNIIYGLGRNKRITYIRNTIEQVGPVQVRNTVNKSLDKEEGEVPCYAIPLAFGGPANESFNIFTASQSKCDDYAKIFHSLSGANDYINIGIELHFVYSSYLYNGSRPKFAYYHFTHNYHREINYGRFNYL